MCQEILTHLAEYGKVLTLVIVNLCLHSYHEVMMANVQNESNTAIVIGAGLGGLAAAMRLGAKGYAVTVFDRLDVPGGRGSSVTQDGHRFDLGPVSYTHLTLPTTSALCRSRWSQYH